MSIIEKIFGTHSQRELKRIEPIVNKIESLRPEMMALAPEDAEFDIGLEELEEDKARGIYDYRLDDDGKGLTLTMKSPGMGIIYMSAGEPINEAGILVIEVNE